MAVDVRPPPAPTASPAPTPEDEFRPRNPVAAWLLALGTLGLYAAVWQYKANDDARRYLRDGSISPGLSFLAMAMAPLALVPVAIYVIVVIVSESVGFSFWFLLLMVAVGLPFVIPPAISIYRTGQRIVRVQERAGLEASCSPGFGLIVAPPLLHIPYYQAELNEVFGKAGSIPGLGLIRGLLVTLRHLLSRSITQQYPHEKPDLPPRTRGVIALKPENCTVCWKCSRECPDWCIYIEAHKETHEPASGGRARSVKVLDRFAIDYALCMYCGICVEVCPFDALFWSPEFEYATYDIVEMTHEKEKLDAWTYTVLPPPELEEGAEPVEEAPAPEAHSEAPTSAAPMAQPGAAEPTQPVQPQAAAEPAVAPAAEQAQHAPEERTAPAPAETLEETPQPGESQPPPHDVRGEVEPDQATYDRVLAEELGKGTDRRVAEGRAKSAAIRAARKAQEGGG
jgi:formate hydrogenlyase subunit 6/NADH:ubiquinone oxidoreductase subunit I